MYRHRNSVRNEHIDYIVKKVFVPASQFVQSQVTGASVILDASFGTGATQYLEVGTSNIGAMRFTATGNDVNYLWTPSDYDNRQPLYIRYLWTSGYAVANGTATFLTTYTAMQTGSTFAAAATGLTKVHGASTKVSATALALYWSNYGILAPLATGANAGGTFHPETIAVALSVNVSAVTGITLGSDFVHLLGMELSYTPRIAFGSSNRPARLLKDGVSSNLELDVTNDL